MNRIILYMPLLNEGTNVYRPVLASTLEKDVYQIEGSVEGMSPEQLGEEWLYPIGSIVKCEKINEDGESYLRVIQLSNISRSEL